MHRQRSVLKPFLYYRGDQVDYELRAFFYSLRKRSMSPQSEGADENTGAINVSGNTKSVPDRLPRAPWRHPAPSIRSGLRIDRR